MSQFSLIDKQPSGQSREYNYYFESVGSDQNLIGIFRGIG